MSDGEVIYQRVTRSERPAEVVDRLSDGDLRRLRDFVRALGVWDGIPLRVMHLVATVAAKRFFQDSDA